MLIVKLWPAGRGSVTGPVWRRRRVTRGLSAADDGASATMIQSPGCVNEIADFFA
jgi:hypothetical protein